LIDALRLPADFAAELNSYVRDEYRQLFWQGIEESPVGPVELWPE
jgi:hypothetical protein